MATVPRTLGHDQPPCVRARLFVVGVSVPENVARELAGGIRIMMRKIRRLEVTLVLKAIDVPGDPSAVLRS